MAVQKLKPDSIESYIESADPKLQARLIKMHECIQKAAPGAIENLKWGMPAYSYEKILVTFKAFKNHIGFYPMPSALAAFRKELAGLKTASASIQFPHDKPLPVALIRNIVKFRVKESNDGTLRWRSK